VNWSSIAILVRKDVLKVIRNPGVRIPLLAAPAVILIALPALLVLGGAGLAASTPIPLDAQTVFEGLRENTLGGTVTTGGGGGAAVRLSGEARWTLYVLEFFLAPLYLLIPLIVATVIAADSFAGERERRTLETLLQTPTTDSELLVAKIVSAWLPALVVSLGGFVAYGVLANLLAWPYLGTWFFPTPMWLVLALWVSPALAAVGLGLMVYVSSRVNSLQAAHQLGSLVVLPIVVLVIAQVTGAALLDVGLVVAMGSVLWLLAALLLAVATRVFTRDQLAAKL